MPHGGDEGQAALQQRGRLLLVQSGMSYALGLIK